jgi:excisionase family DNA binding protein
MSAPVMTDEKIYTVKEVADKLRVAPITVRRMIAAKELRAFVVRGEYRIRQSALDEVMREKEDKGE